MGIIKDKFEHGIRNLEHRLQQQAVSVTHCSQSQGRKRTLKVHALWKTKYPGISTHRLELNVHLAPTLELATLRANLGNGQTHPICL
jgi:hypothetical protein